MAAAAAAPAGDIVKAIKIVTKNLRDMRKSPDDLPPGCEIGPIDESNMLLWKCILQGPAGTVIYVSTTVICASNTQSFIVCSMYVSCALTFQEPLMQAVHLKSRLHSPVHMYVLICIFGSRP
jgi:hypothetical protein